MMSPEEYARSRHAVWAGAAALFTDELGRVLLVESTYRSEWLLPGGGEQGLAQARLAARAAQARWGVHLAAPSPITELPAQGGLR